MAAFLVQVGSQIGTVPIKTCVRHRNKHNHLSRVSQVFLYSRVSWFQSENTPTGVLYKIAFEEIPFFLHFRRGRWQFHFVPFQTLRYKIILLMHPGWWKVGKDGEWNKIGERVIGRSITGRELCRKGWGDHRKWSFFFSIFELKIHLSYSNWVTVPPTYRVLYLSFILFLLVWNPQYLEVSSYLD